MALYLRSLHRLTIACLVFFVTSSLAQAYGDEEKALGFVRTHQWQKAQLAMTQLRDPLVRAIVEFYLLRDSPLLGGFGQYETFFRKHPHWPSEAELIRRAEIALITEGADPGGLLDWFAHHPPLTARGRLYAAQMHGRLTPEDIRQGFRDSDFTENEEEKMMADYRQYIGLQEVIARTDRLLWEGKIDSAKRLFRFLPADRQALYSARVALMQKTKNAEGLLARVPTALRADPGLLYERIRFRQAKGQSDTILELLMQAPKNPPYPAKWWPYRRSAIRDALDDGKIGQAEQLANLQFDGNKLEASEALFLSGWISLTFRHRPAPALDAFGKLYNLADFPISKSRAAYWAARAAAAAGNQAEAKRWMTLAATYPIFFYGQLAQEELYGPAPLKLPEGLRVDEAAWQTGAKNQPLVAVCLALARYGYADLASPFIVNMARSATTPQQAGVAIYTGVRMGRMDYSVRAAKEALNNGFYFPQYLFPVPAIKAHLAVEKPFALAIARQESMFYPTARSPANAIGMMQLLPSTAKLVAKKNDIAYSEQRLDDPEYNMTLGSAYLDELTAHFDDAKVLSVAGYNAGPGRPRDWEAKYGPLSDNDRASVDWIERIPFSETRNYVQRVLENYQVYRALESGGTAPLTARETLRR